MLFSTKTKKKSGLHRKIVFIKLVTAFIKPNMLDDVMLALHHIEGLTGVSTMGVHGFGRDHCLDDREVSLDKSLIAA